MSSIKAVIFDFDGVILDSASIKTEAFLELFKEYPQHQQAIKAYHLEHQGITRYKKFEWIYKQLLSRSYNEETENRLGRDFTALVFEKIMKAEALPGAIELLETLHIPSFIASGTPDEELNEIITKRNLSKYFRSVYGSNISKEEAIDKVSEQEAIPYSNILFVGDAITDYRAAKLRGTSFIAVYSESMEEYWQKKGIKPVKDLMEIYEKTDFLVTDK